MTRRRDTRYPHAFSKGRPVGFVSEGSWRGARRPQSPCTIQTEALGAPAPGGGGAKTMTVMEQPSGGSTTRPPSYPIPLDPRRWKHLKVSPTVATIYKSHLGLAVICAGCLHGVAHRNPGLPDHFRRQWHLTLLELERKCRCEMCGARNARIYPWSGDAGADLGLDGPPGEGAAGPAG